MIRWARRICSVVSLLLSAGLKSIDLSEDYSNIRLYMDTFVRYMNNIAKEFGMKNTLFTNPHGLSIR